MYESSPNEHMKRCKSLHRKFGCFGVQIETFYRLY